MRCLGEVIEVSDGDAMADFDVWLGKLSCQMQIAKSDHAWFRMHFHALLSAAGLKT